MHLIINSILLSLDIVVGSSVTLECALHTLHNASLGVDPVLVELLSVMFLRVILKVP